MDMGRSFWFMAGLGCGTVVGMLYAPLPGVRTRAIARAKAKEAQRLWEHRSERRARNATGSATRMAAATPDARERIRRTLDAARGSGRL
jgi:gas vesicle protein